jgi:AcrR family transcriptional regulator
MTTRSREASIQRRARILAATAKLMAANDYARVSMADIGEACGMGASTIYWHFGGKQEILVTLFDDCLDRLLADQATAIAECPDARAALWAVVARHVDFVLHERPTATTYYRQSGHIAEPDAARLRHKQRTYIDAWAGLLSRVRGDLTPPRSEALVRAAIGAVQSDLFHRSPAPLAARHAELTAIACRVQDIPTT